MPEPSNTLGMNSERWGSAARGRNHTVLHGQTVWTVSNASNLQAEFAVQVQETLTFLDASLQKAGSSRAGLLSVQVILADIHDRQRFDALWCDWIGEDPTQWPQRVVFGASLAPGLLLEISAVAAVCTDPGTLHGRCVDEQTEPETAFQDPGVPLPTSPTALTGALP